MNTYRDELQLAPVLERLVLFLLRICFTMAPGLEPDLFVPAAPRLEQMVFSAGPLLTVAYMQGYMK